MIRITEEQYLAHKAMIKDMAIKYHRRTGAEYEELFAEGNLVFCECCQGYDPKRGAKFSTYLHKSLSNKMYNLCSEHIKERQSTIDSSVLDYVPASGVNTNAIEASVCLAESLTPDMKKVLDVIFMHDPISLIWYNAAQKKHSSWRWSKKPTNQKAIRWYLKSKYGWTNSRVANAFGGIRELLKEFS